MAVANKSNGRIERWMVFMAISLVGLDQASSAFRLRMIYATGRRTIPGAPKPRIPVVSGRGVGAAAWRRRHNRAAFRPRVASSPGARVPIILADGPHGMTTDDRLEIRRIGPALRAFTVSVWGGAAARFVTLALGNAG